MEIKIIPANLRDSKNMIKLEAKCFHMRYIKEFVWFWKPLIQHTHVYKAVFGRRIVGGIIAFPTKNPKVLHIESVFVNPKFQQRGIATKLIKKVVKVSGCRKVVLDTMPKWDSAMALYRKLDFKKVKLMKNYYEDGTDRILLVKRIR